MESPQVNGGIGLLTLVGHLEICTIYEKLERYSPNFDCDIYEYVTNKRDCKGE
jgi:hypothetical protein